MSELMTLVAAGLLGAIVGSYLNVVIHRRPEREEEARVSGSRSRCPKCKALIPIQWNLPIVSWLLLRGRARCCGTPISPRYVLVEALTALLFVLVAWFAPSGHPVDLATLTGAAMLGFALHAYFVANLTANTFIDFEFRLLPDRLTRPLAIVGLLGSLFLTDLPWVLETELSPVLNSLLTSLLGLAAGMGVTWAVRWLGRVVFRKEAMGFGDVKLMAGIGAFLGWQGALMTFLLGCVFGAVSGVIRSLFTKDPYVAFGPYLALGAVVQLFARAELIEFLTVTWPEWQERNPSYSLALLTAGLIGSIVVLIFVRRGRTT